MYSIQSLLDQIGGPVTALMLLMSMVATCLILSKVWELLRFGTGSQMLAEQALANLQPQSPGRDLNEALLLVRNRRSPRLQVLATTLQLGQTPELSQQDFREESLRVARQSLNHMAAGLRPLEVIANLAPLMGLFGTVLGMIEAFQAMEAAGAQVDPSVLSGGIWQALLTTAVGLAIAIPVSMIHSALERRHELETQATQDILDRLFLLFGQRQQLQAQQSGTALVRRA